MGLGLRFKTCYLIYFKILLVTSKRYEQNLTQTLKFIISITPSFIFDDNSLGNEFVCGLGLDPILGSIICNGLQSIVDLE